MYKFIRTVLFWFDAEAVHHFSMNIMKAACSVGGIRSLFKKLFAPPQREVINVCKIPFKNRVGLAAGFDKNAQYLRELETLGFGFIEIGTVTPIAQEGNEKPRLFRLPKDKALINRMGFNNDGVKKVAGRLKEWKMSRGSGVRSSEPSSRLPAAESRLIIGGNIGKNKSTPNEEAWKDYEICFKELFDCVDYFVVNVSSPNTPGLRELQEKDSLRKILSHLQVINNQQVIAKPLLLKIAPDLTQSQIDDVIDLAIEIKLDGLVIANTTVNRSGLSTPDTKLSTIGSGGLSGKPLAERSTEMVRYIHQQTKGQLPIIASGGIFTAEDVKEKMEAGASLIQVWTGFIYEGPGIVKKILGT
jgi:dihydroorotate dehydrogenase